MTAQWMGSVLGVPAAHAHDSLHDALWRFGVRAEALGHFDTDFRQSLSPARLTAQAFGLHALPQEVTGQMLNVNSQVNLLSPYLAEGGWPTTQLLTDAELTDKLMRHGKDAFGTVVRYVFGDVRATGFGDAHFTVVLALESLSQLYASDVPVALAEMVRILEPGGQLIFTLTMSSAENGLGAVSSSQLERLIRPVAKACQDEAALDDLIHSTASISDDTPVTVGFAFELPNDAAVCLSLVQALREIAQTMDYPPSDKNYQRVQTSSGDTFWMTPDPVMIDAVTTREFEPDVHAFYTKFLRPDDVVFDVGAHVGIYSRLFSRRVGNAGLVYAFEPTSDTFDCLIRNSLDDEQSNLRLNHLGLSQENALLTLRHAAAGQSALNSFGEPFGEGTSDDGQYVTESVLTTTLDNFVDDYQIQRLDLLKIDVEGWEERVLRGGIGVLLRMTPVLVLEFTSAAAQNANSSCRAVARFVSVLGYQLYRYVPHNNTLEVVEVERNNWTYANLIAVSSHALKKVMARLAGDAIVLDAPPSIDWRVLLEENRSLRQRLTAGYLDREVALLQQLLQTSDIDRAARLTVIEKLTGQIETLRTQLDEVNVDRAARLMVIERLTAQVEMLQSQFQQSEADRAASLAIIEQLKAQLETIQSQLQQSEADRAARLDVIQRLDAQYQTSQVTINSVNKELATMQTRLEHEKAVNRTQQAQLLDVEERLKKVLSNRAVQLALKVSNDRTTAD